MTEIGPKSLKLTVTPLSVVAHHEFHLYNIWKLSGRAVTDVMIFVAFFEVSLLFCWMRLQAR